MVATIDDAFLDGVMFLPLDSVRDPELVRSTIGKALGVSDGPDAMLGQRLRLALAERQLLLVLDNFEQVIDAAPDVAELLAACPALTVLVTSRAPLRIAGEHDYPIPTLDVPDPGPASLDQLAQSKAVRLFAQRARAIRPDFALTDETAPLVAEICRQLDGLPLAIELAAARVRVLPLVALRDRLDHRLPLLTGGGRDVPRRQQTMAAAIAWSHDLLAPEQRCFFRELAVFIGGFTLEAAAAVAGANQEGDVLDLVTALVDQSLLRPMECVGDAPRYMMLETIREFAEANLVESGEAEAARERHAMWCLEFATQVLPRIEPIVNADAVNQFILEHANIRAALTWLDVSGRDEEFARLAAELGMPWYMAGYSAEGLARTSHALSLVPDRADYLRVRLLFNAGALAQDVLDPAAHAYLMEGWSLARAAGYVYEEGRCTFLLGMRAEDRGDYTDAEALFNSAMDIFRRLETPYYQLRTDYHLGIVALGQGDNAHAAAMFERTLVAAKDQGDAAVSLWCLHHLAFIAYDRRDSTQLVSLLRQLQQVEENWGTIPRMWWDGLGVVAALASVLGDATTVAHTLGSSAAHCQDVLQPLPERAYYESYEREARGQLGDAVYQAAWKVGRRMSRSETQAEIDRLLTLADAGPVPSRPGADSGLLTPREREVLQLLVAGRSNREIAEALFISHRTATTHVTNILAKFDVPTRAAAVSYAYQYELL